MHFPSFGKHTFCMLDCQEIILDYCFSYTEQIGSNTQQQYPVQLFKWSFLWSIKCPCQVWPACVQWASERPQWRTASIRVIQSRLFSMKASISQSWESTEMDFTNCLLCTMTTRSYYRPKSQSHQVNVHIQEQKVFARFTDIHFWPEWRFNTFSILCPFKVCTDCTLAYNYVQEGTGLSLLYIIQQCDVSLNKIFVNHLLYK